MFVSGFCKQILVNGVITTIAFSNDLVTPRNQYLLYVLASGAGDVLGRPYLGYLSCCGIEDKFAIRRPWFLLLLNVFIVTFMVFNSWFRFRFLSHVYTTAAVVLVNTLLQGMPFNTILQFVGEDLALVV